MSHFAQIDDNNIVINVIVAEQDIIDSGLLGDPSKWIQTSYNTSGGVHAHGKTPLRKNFAGIGMIYDPVRDAFYKPKPEGDFWIFNEDKCIWEFPMPFPNNGNSYYFCTKTLSWILTDDPLLSYVII
jgi:hypothetical protein